MVFYNLICSISTICAKWNRLFEIILNPISCILWHYSKGLEKLLKTQTITDFGENQSTGKNPVKIATSSMHQCLC